ncbi:MAG: hypothetical protein KC900_13815 [Candidatus Omnitrophica bacterium]|nr:hypothetical protein [Candidatus Omnitrophota bacterium]
MKNREDIGRQQREICEKYGTLNFTPPEHMRVGINENVRTSLQPINGLRNPVEGIASGWFIWAGEEWSDADDFFKPICISHLEDWCPQVIKYLALPPGYRFLIDDKGYEDVWYDEKLLDI